MTLNRRDFLQITTITGMAALGAPGLLANRSAESLYADSIVIGYAEEEWPRLLQ